MVDQKDVKRALKVPVIDGKAAQKRRNQGQMICAGACAFHVDAFNDETVIAMPDD